jgi:hypothetical protein
MVVDIVALSKSVTLLLPLPQSSPLHKPSASQILFGETNRSVVSARMICDTKKPTVIKLKIGFPMKNFFPFKI